MEVELPLAPHLLVMNKSATLDVAEALREKALVRPRHIENTLGRPAPDFHAFTCSRHIGSIT